MKFFKSGSEFRSWLEKHHASATELFVGFHRKDSGLGGITYPEALEEVLCFGWIDGVRHKIDDTSYSNRFTPRKARSVWSEVNRAHMKRLMAAGRVAPAGMLAYERRDAAPAKAYSFENKTECVLSAADQKLFRANRSAWKFFSAQPAWYQRTATWLVISAKKEATRARRLETLIADSTAGRWIGQLQGR